MNKIEQLAKAFRESALDCNGWCDDALIDLAREAIEAMRVPTEGMDAAGDDEWDHAAPTASLIWDAMIDAALEGE